MTQLHDGGPGLCLYPQREPKIWATIHVPLCVCVCDVLPVSAWEHVPGVAVSPPYTKFPLSQSQVLVSILSAPLRLAWECSLRVDQVLLGLDVVHVTEGYLLELHCLDDANASHSPLGCPWHGGFGRQGWEARSKGKRTCITSALNAMWLNLAFPGSRKQSFFICVTMFYADEIEVLHSKTYCLFDLLLCVVALCALISWRCTAALSL